LDPPGLVPKWREEIRTSIQQIRMYSRDPSGTISQAQVALSARDIGTIREGSACARSSFARSASSGIGTEHMIGRAKLRGAKTVILGTSKLFGLPDE
jgi:hypothetical protein